MSTLLLFVNISSDYVGCLLFVCIIITVGLYNKIEKKIRIQNKYIVATSFLLFCLSIWACSAYLVDYICNYRKPNITLVNYIDSNGIITEEEIHDSLLVDNDSIYRGQDNIYFNASGKKLIDYKIKYCSRKDSSFISEDTKYVNGKIIKPNIYFKWIGDNSLMFRSPPYVYVLHGKAASYETPIDIRFLDFQEQIPYYVNVEESNDL